MTWKSKQNIGMAICAIIIAILGTHLAMEHKANRAKGKPKCVVDNVVLWDKDNQWELWDIWSCKKHFDEALAEARERLGAHPNELTREILEETYRILKSRRKVK